MQSPGASDGRATADVPLGSEAEAGWVEVLAVFAFVRVATSVPLTPGGLGIVELGLIAGLTAAGGDRPEVVARRARVPDPDVRAPDRLRCPDLPLLAARPLVAAPGSPLDAALVPAGGV